MKNIFIVGLIFIIYSCSAPDYKNRIEKIGKDVILLSETYDSKFSYRDTVKDFAYGNNNLFNDLNRNNYRSSESEVIGAKGELPMYSRSKAGYYMKLIKNDKEYWIRLRYDRQNDNFHMVNYISHNK